MRIHIYDKIIALLKIQLFRKEKKRNSFFKREATTNIIPSNNIFEVKKKLNKFLILKETKIFNANNKIKENQINKFKNGIKVNKILINLIQFIIINLLFQIKSNILFNLFQFQYSKITLKIKGIGDSIIFGNESRLYFQRNNFPNDIYINGIMQDIIEYKYYFNQTENIVELIWKNNINNCSYMFSKCSNITEIDLSNFNTSNVEFMQSMFSDCSSLISLNLSNFNTSKVKRLDSMFYKCSSLISLNLSNFDTSKVYSMGYMFYYCSSLTSLDLSKFNTSLVSSMYDMFVGCSNLVYINMINFEENRLDSLSQYSGMLKDVTENIVICINNFTAQPKIIPQINEITCHVIDCANDWKSKQKKIINNTNECIQSCVNSSLYKYEYNGKCYENCKQGFLNGDNNIQANKCKCELDKCLSCPNVALNKGLCEKCNINYYPKENDPLNLGEYINCYKELEGYYLDNNIFKQCYYSCKTCNISGNIKNHNCLECNENYTYEINNSNYINCYENCSYYHYFDDEYNYYCTKNSSCPYKYPKLNKDKMECFKISINDMIEDLMISKKNETEKLTKEEEIEFYDNLFQIIEKGFTDNYNTTKLDNGQDEIITTDKMIVTFTTSQNQKNNINNNMTAIDLGECETLLKNEYNISSNETLYMKKIDIVQDGMKIPKVEYDVYCKLFGTNLIKLNLTVCSKSKILIFMPFEIKDELYKYNSSSEYYNDICNTTTSEDGIDISLKDRKKEFIDNNNFICQEDCDFSEYNKETSKAACSCKVKESSQSFANMNINKARLLDNFKNINNIINFKFLICYEKLFNKEGILNNIGSYIMLAFILFHIITIFTFNIQSFHYIKKKIRFIASKLRKTKENKKDKKKEYSKKQISKINDIYIYKRNKNISNKQKPNNIKKSLDYEKIKIKSNYKIHNHDKIKNKENIKNYIDEEINGFSYSLALKYDKRTYCQYYISLLKTQHNLISALFNNNDYNSKIIKINLFFIGFAIEFTVNGLFFNDDTMHKIYESKGEFDLENQLPIAVYSTLISLILNIPLNFLALSNDSIINFKQDNKKNNIKNNTKNLINALRIKFILYFIISFLFLLFFWYYISMFGVIYKNTQFHLLKDTLMSFSLSLIMPFGIYIFPGFFRIPALSSKKYKRECLYNFSKFLQSF